MPYTTRDGVRLFYTDSGSGDPPLIFVHGWCCDWSHWRRQLPAFRRKHRAVAVDLRGHGHSSKPKQDYTMDGFAEDLEWLIGDLGLRKPVVIGHSMGGVIALRLAGRGNRDIAGLVIVDSPIFSVLPQEQLDTFVQALEGPTYRDVARAFIDARLFHPGSPKALRKHVTDAMADAPQHVMASAMRDLLVDNTDLAKNVNVPSLFIDAGRSLEELQRIEAGIPGIRIGRTVGAGHFNMLEAPEQFNGMLRKFLDQLGSGST